MKRLSLLASLLLTSLVALAYHCPQDMKLIDEELAKKPKLSEKELAEVRRLRTDGEKLHSEGKHQESVEALAKAMKILRIDSKY